MEVIKGLHKKSIEERVEEGNMIIQIFMGAYNIDIFSPINKHKINQYNVSWDLLMDVIHKIKSKVFHEGYDMFMPEHHAYVSIGNACYDADLFEAWKAVVRWVTLNFDFENYRFDIPDIRKAYEPIVYQTKETERVYFKVSPHTVRRYKQRINYNATIEEICNHISTKALYDSYKVNGDGKYYIGDRCIVAIDDWKIITIYKSSLEDEYNNYEKIKELSVNKIYRN